MKRSARWIGHLFRRAFREWQKDKVSRLAAGLSYYTIFSLAPVLLIATAIAGVVFGQDVMRERVLGEVGGLVGSSGADTVRTMMEGASRPRDSILASIIGVVTLIVGAVGVFAHLQDALNTIWEVRPKKGAGFKVFLRRRLASFGLVVVIGFLLMVSLVISAIISGAGDMLAGVMPAALAHLLNLIASFVISALLFALIFKVLPDVKIKWRDVWVGAMVTSALFQIGRFVIGLYLGRSSVSSSYGAAGSVIVMLLWIYFSTQIMLFGAEFTQIQAEERGSPFRPAKGAEPVTAEKRAEEGIPKAEPQQA